MAIMIIILVFILMLKLNQKGKAYNEQRFRDAATKSAGPRKEEMYRKRLQEEGIDEDLIAVIIPTIMDDK